MAIDVMLRELLSGMGASISIFVLTLLFSLPLGLLVAFARMSKIKPLQWLMKIYISIMRGTPLLSYTACSPLKDQRNLSDDLKLPIPLDS